MPETLKKTPFYNLHTSRGAKMVPFAGYEMPVQYEGMGVMKEHLHTRKNAGVFDVSHMGQVFISGGHDPAETLEKIIPSDLQNQPVGQMRYTVLLNDKGGIVDDLIITRLTETVFYLVLNASRIDQDIARLNEVMRDDMTLNHDHARALIAVQGPRAAEIITAVFPEAKDIKFMKAAAIAVDGHTFIISRSGYTGEDGFEISAPHPMEGDLMNDILSSEYAELIGLGARDSLRLEAGLCLYGHDLNENITPVEAGLTWIIPENRRAAADFAGADKICEQLEHGSDIIRVGLKPQGAAPLREGVELYNAEGQKIGHITSGTYAPSLERPIAMGYVKSDYKKEGTEINALLRGKSIPVTVTKARFIES